MIIKPDTLSEALESILRQCLIQCDTSYKGWKKSQHGGTKDAYSFAFNSSYATLVEMEKFVVKDYLNIQQRLDWDKVKVLNADLNNLNKTFDVNDLVWCNRNTGEIEEKI